MWPINKIVCYLNVILL